MTVETASLVSNGLVFVYISVKNANGDKKTKKTLYFGI